MGWKIKARILFVVCFSVFSSSWAGGDPRPMVVGYYPSWETGVGPAQINYKLFTHLCHAFVDADKQGNLKMEGNMPSVDLTARAHAAGVKVLISIGGENSGKQFFNAMSRDPKALNRFVDSVTDLLVKNHYDGVDIDWEFPENERDGRNITVLASLLRKKLGQRAPGALLTMALPSGDWVGKWFDAASLSSLLDFANVMTYDFHGPWGANGHNAALYPVAKDPEAGANIVKTMDYWTQQKKWPGKKLLVGIACFGHGFVGGWYENPKKKTPYPDFHFTDSLKMVQAGWKKHWDKEAAVPYLASPDGKEFISYDDEKSVGLKAQWARSSHYPGIFFWEITEDFMNDRHVLVEAARKAFLGK